MGVDYSGNYGIGIRVIEKDFDEDHEYYEDFLGWLDEQLGDSPYSYFETGSASYGGESNDFYVVIDEPFDKGYDLNIKVQQFLNFLDEKEIEYDGKVDVVGGLHIW